MSKNNKKDIPLWAQIGHGKPVTRRDFLATGIIPFSASLLVPNWIQLLTPSRAEAADCATTSSSMIPFVSLNLAGGAGLAANFVPMDQGGQLLPSYDILGLGDNQVPITREFGNAPFAGNGISKFIDGLRQRAPTAIGRTAFVAVCVRSRDDSGENRFSVDGMLAKAGLAGSLLPNLGRRGGSVTGVNQAPAIVSPPAPLAVSNFNSLGGALGYAGVINQKLKPDQRSSLSRLVSSLTTSQTNKLMAVDNGATTKELLECAGIKNTAVMASGVTAVDPRQDPNAGGQLSALWGINGGTGGGDGNLIFSAMSYNAIKNQSGSVALEIGGYDYHNNTRTSGDAKDREAGEAVGRILETAAILNKPVFVYVTSDGAVVSAKSNARDSVWASDRGSAGVAYIFYFNPAGRPATSSFQIGHFTAGQAADDKFVTGNSPEQAAAAVFANYLAANKRMDLFNPIAGRALDNAALNQVLKIA